MVSWGSGGRLSTAWSPTLEPNPGAGAAFWDRAFPAALLPFTPSAPCLHDLPVIPRKMLQRGWRGNFCCCSPGEAAQPCARGEGNPCRGRDLLAPVRRGPEMRGSCRIRLLPGVAQARAARGDPEQDWTHPGVTAGVAEPPPSSPVSGFAAGWGIWAFPIEQTDNSCHSPTSP